MKRIAVACEGNQVAQHFGHCEQFMFFDTDFMFGIGRSPPRSVLYLLSRQDIGTSIAPLGIALIDSILLVFTRPNRDTIIFAYQLAFM